jgi:hypothetical protein
MNTKKIYPYLTFSIFAKKNTLSISNQIRKEVRKEAKQMLKRGITRQETYLSLGQKFGDNRLVYQVLCNLQSASAIKKYGIWNYLLEIPLAAIAIIIISQSSFNRPPVLILLYIFCFIYIVQTKQTRHYINISVFSTFVSLVFMVDFIVSKTGNFTEVLIAGALILLSVLTFWLARKLSPQPIEKLEEFFDNTGAKRRKVVFEFTD